MAINARALEHYENAVRMLTAACSDEANNETSSVLTQIASVSLDLARFCVENHALVHRIDENEPVKVSYPDSLGGPKVWGGPGS